MPARSQKHREAVDFYKANRESLLSDSYRAESYLRSQAVRMSWPRLLEIANVLRAWQEASE